MTAILYCTVCVARVRPVPSMSLKKKGRTKTGPWCYLLSMYVSMCVRSALSAELWINRVWLPILLMVS